MMQALLFRYSMPRFAFARVMGTLTPRAYLSTWGPTALREIPEPVLPADDWAIVRTSLCGVCGSDVKQIFLKARFDNPLRGLVTFPQVLGHEAVGVIQHVGPGVKLRRVGERVALNPWLSCVPRSIVPPCGACQRGEYSLCAHFADGAFPPGMHAGNCRDVTGGFAPLFAAHESQLFPIPDGVTLDQAVLADPFSVCLHAILKAPPPKRGLALVYGAGVLGLLSVATLRALFPSARVVIVARYTHQEERACQMGAERVILAREPAEIVEAVAEMVGARVHRPPRGLPWLLRGVDVLYDTVGSARTLEVGIRIAGPRAPIVITGVGVPARFEWTPHYFKEVALLGSNAFGIEQFDGVRQHAFEHYLQMVEEGRLDVSSLITHRFRLEEFRRAFLVMHDKARHNAVKAVFAFTPD